MGFHVNRFRTNVDPLLICFFCKDVLSSPVQTQACEHYFCHECVTDWLEDNHSCPIDHKLLTSSDLRKAPKVLTNLLSELEIECDFAPDGCEEYLKLGALADHVKECPANPDLALKCPYNCGAIRRRQSIDEPFPPHCCVTYILSTIRGEHVSEQINGVIDALLRMQETITSQEKKIQGLERRVALKQSRSKVRPTISKPVPVATQRASATNKKQAAPSSPNPVAPTVSEEQRALVNGLNEGLIRSPEVIRAMAAVDFKNFYDENPYDKNRALAIGMNLEELLLHTKGGAKVLYAREDSLYVPVCLALMIAEGTGSVVAPTDSALSLGTVYKNYGSLIVSGRMTAHYQSDVRMRGKGYPALAPYDLVVGNSTSDFKALNDQLKPRGRILILQDFL